MEKKTLAIIMPNYNYSRFLKASLQAILNQTRKPDKLVIIDDCSTDNSLRIIKDLIKDIPYAVLLENSINKGIAYSVNKALSYVNTDYVCFIASDDIISLDFIYEMMKFIEKHSDVGLCCSLPAFFKDAEHVWSDDFDLNTKKVFQPEELVKIMRKTKFWIATHASIVKTDEIKKRPHIDILKHYSDWFCFLNIAFQNKVGFISKSLAFMRIHETSYSAKKQRYKNSKKIYSFLIDRISRDKKIRQKFIKSKVLSSLDNYLIIFLIFRIKYWKYFPGIIYGKILRFINRCKRKFIKLFTKNLNVAQYLKLFEENNN